MSRRIIVSDLHIDTWTDRRLGRENKSKKEYLLSFLDWCRQSDVREFIINGDLMDLPPYSTEDYQVDESGLIKEILARLVEFAYNVPITYVFGNHDIGVSGMRNFGLEKVPVLEKTRFHYPTYIVNDYPSNIIIIEHGHRVDPALFLYLIDLERLAFREDNFEIFQYAMQRRNNKDFSRRAQPGVFDPIGAGNESAYDAARYGSQPLASASIWFRLWRLTRRFRRLITGKLKREWWAQAAVDQMQKYADDTTALGESLKQNLYLIYGHTHRADYRDDIHIKGTHGIYINSGTWTESSDRGWYLDVDENGKIWLRDWINEAPEQ